MVSTQDSESCNPSSTLGRTFLFFFMPKDIASFFSQNRTSADKRKEALAKRKKILEELDIKSVIVVLL